MRFSLALLAIRLSLAAPAPQQSPPVPAGDGKNYIVTLKPGNSVEGVSFDIVNPLYTYNFEKFQGIVAPLTADEAAKISADPRVASVHLGGEVEDPFVGIPLVVPESKENREFRESVSSQVSSGEIGLAPIVQVDAPWGLARISSRETGGTDYTYDSSGGEGTCTYIVDSGIQASHEDFGGRATLLADISPEPGSGGVDTQGHGTHCAGTTGGTVYGVAKETRIFGIKFCYELGCPGASLPAGIQEAINHYQANRDSLCRNGGVVSLSLGISNYGWEEEYGYNNPEFDAVNAAVEQGYNAGLFIAAAAGNANLSAEYFGPAASPYACTVSASDIQDVRPVWANWGPPVDVFAPGVQVLSTWIGPNNNETAIFDGTSMATPHIAGLAAYLLGITPGLAPGALCERIKSLATKDVVELGDIDRFPTTRDVAYNGLEQE
ncbi:subtilisin-like protein [Eremomyces bilateralis CBS 781.70]|uniref:Subtilisin-like protein n=1 Tax=Eremomyces bilateralis CBS 781.70 TaxID=1392243 RepID=A0A6G1FWD3_9PEZI|nr:subtilisin-like protein [Eremomyces bilateralis CBS 781.70]KAF1809990.1 subtilisin-like protein [Eremomyces bilateralis CBS 781.70]